LGFEQKVREDTSCCFALQDKTWVRGPENDWEFYYVKDDAPSMSYADDDEPARWTEDRQTACDTTPEPSLGCC
ncbi:MAG TPA: hypothetical protein VIK05_05565, partial [Ilumatobacteraceae bacterium]